MEAPNKIYLHEEDFARIYTQPSSTIDDDIEYIRKDIMDETIETAEDHAYFAGKEKLREELLEWCREKAKEYKQMDDDFGGDVFLGNRHAFLEVIDKLNSM